MRMSWLKNKFLKDTLSLATGTVMAQFITIACSPIITRLFSPEEYGKYTLFVAISSFIAIISMFRYENAIVLPKSDKEALNVISLCFSLLVFVFLASLLFFVLLLLFNHGKQTDGELPIFYIVIPFFVLVQGIRLITNNWNTRKNQFRKISVGNVTRSATANTANITVGTFQLINSGGLILGTLIGQTLETIYLTIVNFKVLKLAAKTLSVKNIKPVFYKYIDFFKVNTPHVLIDSLRNYISPIVISLFFSEQILGYYSLMFTVIMLPVTLIGSVLSKVFYGKLAHKYARKEDVMPMVRNVLKASIAIPIVPALVIFFFGETLFSFVFGASWGVAGEYAAALSLYMYIYFVSASITFIPYVIQKLKVSFFYGISINVSFFLIIIIGSLLKVEFLTILQLINVITSLCFVVFIVHVLNMLKIENAKNVLKGDETRD